MNNFTEIASLLSGNKKTEESPIPTKVAPNNLGVGEASKIILGSINEVCSTGMAIIDTVNMATETLAKLKQTFGGFFQQPFGQYAPYMYPGYNYGLPTFAAPSQYNNYGLPTFAAPSQYNNYGLPTFAAPPQYGQAFYNAPQVAVNNPYNQYGNGYGYNPQPAVMNNPYYCQPGYTAPWNGGQAYQAMPSWAWAFQGTGR